MKLLTLNIHGTLSEEALRHVVRAIQAEMPQVIALQEVCQPMSAPPVPAPENAGYVPAQQSIPLRAGNPAVSIVQRLHSAGVGCSWTYLPVKAGHDVYDEGLALLAPQGRITAVDSRCISRTQDYADWRKRSVLAVQLAGQPDWFCCVHMGWWRDLQEPFLAQWEALQIFLQAWRHETVWLMGDFNAPAERRGEGYDRVVAGGWHDAYRLAQRREGAATIAGVAEGWEGVPEAGLRIDQVWCSRAAEIAECRVVFDGREYPAVSDHAGVLVLTAPDGIEGGACS